MKFYTRQRRLPSVIIVSLIDILAILLIFVIVTTTFRRDQPEVSIQLPESKTAAAELSATDPMILTVKGENEIFLDQNRLSLNELGAELRKLVSRSPDRPLALNADKTAPFGLIIKILDVMKEAGVKSSVSAFAETGS
jgi:biopolymer transport protein ExbD